MKKLLAITAIMISMLASGQINITTEDVSKIELNNDIVYKSSPSSFFEFRDIVENMSDLLSEYDQIFADPFSMDSDYNMELSNIEDLYLQISTGEHLQLSWVLNVDSKLNHATVVFASFHQLGISVTVEKIGI